MIPNPIHKVLSTLRSSEVDFLLIGGQACVLYGAVEFSRDTDILLLTDAVNVEKLSSALQELHAENIAVPPFSVQYLERGHAIHFRCRHPDAAGIRVDVMSVMRGVDTFKQLWDRRTTVEVASGEVYNVISLPDLVKSKKTQRDKDWPMIRRLVEANYAVNSAQAQPEQVDFWLMECRTPSLMIELAREYPDRAKALQADRPAVQYALAGDLATLEHSLRQEADREREADKAYWAPLRAELEKLRHQKRK